MNTYETLFIIHPDLEESDINGTIDLIQDVITSGGGKILKLDKWGRRQLAYMIQKKREGFYVLLHFEAPPQLIAELTRRFKLSDKIMRNLILQLNKEQIAEIFDEESAKKRAARGALRTSFNEDDGDDMDLPDDELVASTEV